MFDGPSPRPVREPAHLVIMASLWAAGIVLGVLLSMALDLLLRAV